MTDTDLIYDGDPEDRYSAPIGESPDRSVFLRTLFVVGAVLFVAFWVWALFFSSSMGRTSRSCVC